MRSSDPLASLAHNPFIFLFIRGKRSIKSFRKISTFLLEYITAFLYHFSRWYIILETACPYIFSSILKQILNSCFNYLRHNSAGADFLYSVHNLVHKYHVVLAICPITFPFLRQIIACLYPAVIQSISICEVCCIDS